ncbi:hypothetical protein [Solitalea canadensis]|uniref:hypothetical protein n=1 Tax=Solitalea canadensis TaxID=995 RepID=UPI00145E824E|nr:hypothetical protein [Solitalea canadensis]
MNNLPLPPMAGTDWVKNIRTNEVKWDANVNASTRFAANSEWQYIGAVGTTYHTANGTKQVFLGDNGHWSYINNQRNLNWGEFTGQINELKPMLDATAAGITGTVYGLAAASGGFTSSLLTGLGSGVADFTAQMAFNGQDINAVNWTSVGAMALFKNPLVASTVGSGLGYSSGFGFKNSFAFGEKTNVKFASETIGGHYLQNLGLINGLIMFHLLKKHLVNLQLDF